jgi:hypothetical protein
MVSGANGYLRKGCGTRKGCNSMGNKAWQLWHTPGISSGYGCSRKEVSLSQQHTGSPDEPRPECLAIPLNPLIPLTPPSPSGLARTLPP